MYTGAVYWSRASEANVGPPCAEHDHAPRERGCGSPVLHSSPSTLLLPQMAPDNNETRRIAQALVTDTSLRRELEELEAIDPAARTRAFEAISQYCGAILPYACVSLSPMCMSRACVRDACHACRVRPILLVQPPLSKIAHSLLHRIITHLPPFTGQAPRCLPSLTHSLD